MLLLIFFAVVSARMLSESSTCHENILSLCGNGLTVTIPFILSTYFLDSFLSENSAREPNEKINKQTLVNLFLLFPYLIYLVYVALEFFNSVSIVTIEYIVSFNLFLTFIIYGIFYWLNQQSAIRKVNTIFMATLLLSLFFLRFV